MFGLFKKKKPEDGFKFKELPDIRNCLEVMTGEAMNIYVGTLVSYVLKLGKTSDDVEKAKTRMLGYLQKFVRAEILLDRQEHGGGGVSLAELASLRPGQP